MYMAVVRSRSPEQGLIFKCNVCFVVLCLPRSQLALVVVFIRYNLVLTLLLGIFYWGVFLQTAYELQNAHVSLSVGRRFHSIDE